MRDERGLSASVETALILPAVVLFVGLLLTLARIALTDQHVEAAVAAAARAASLERSVAAAQTAAGEALERSLGERGIDCLSTALTVDASGVARELGEAATVSVTATCTVGLGDVSLPFVPGSVRVAGSHDSPVDPLRGK